MEFEYGSESDSEMYSDSDSDMYSEVEDSDMYRLAIKQIITNLLEYDDEKHKITQKYEFHLMTGEFSNVLKKELDLLDENEETELKIVSEKVFKLPISQKTKKYREQEMEKFNRQQEMKKDNIRHKYTAEREIILNEPHRAYKIIKDKKLSELSEKYTTIHINLIYKYVVDYLFDHFSPVLSLTDVERLKKQIKTNFSKIIKRYRLRDDYETKLYEDIEKGLNIVLDFYLINEIHINEIKILPKGHECVDVMSALDEPTILGCLTDTNNLLFVTVNTSNCDFNSFSYHAVCYSKNLIQKQIIENQKVFNCFINDPAFYVKLPIGPNAINVYIPLLSALAILQSDKVIFYLLAQDSTKCSESQDSDTYHNPRFCDQDTSRTPVMYLAKCGGFNCAAKGWTGAEDVKDEVVKTKNVDLKPKKVKNTLGLKGVSFKKTH